MYVINKICNKCDLLEYINIYHIYQYALQKNAALRFLNHVKNIINISNLHRSQYYAKSHIILIVYTMAANVSKVAI